MSNRLIRYAAVIYWHATKSRRPLMYRLKWLTAAAIEWMLSTAFVAALGYLAHKAISG